MLEWLANGFLLASVVLAARNNIHTWWLGILANIFLAVVFAGAKLYANATLMVFFIAINVLGWHHWRKGATLAPIAQMRVITFGWLTLAALSCAWIFGLFLHLLTDAAAALWDSALLGLSVLAQILLMRRYLQTWWLWLVIDALAVPLYLQRDLYLTAILYAGLWLNAWHGLLHWRRELYRQRTGVAADLAAEKAE